jgi:hypothetical protein
LKQAFAYFLFVEMPAGDQLEQIEGGFIQLLVAGAGCGIGDGAAFILERSLRPGDRADLTIAAAVALGSFFLLFLADLLQQPIERVGDLPGVAAPLIGLAIGAHTRRQDHVAAGAADIEAGRDLGAAVADAG